MTADRLEELLSQLGHIFKLPLHTDKSHACSIHITPLTIQIQLDSIQENLFFFSKIIALPPGRFRENVLREAMKANGLSDPRAGVLGYIATTNHLTLHQCYPLSILNGDRLAALFGGFFDLGASWHQAIESGQSAPMG